MPQPPVLAEVDRIVREEFWDTKLNGVDWKTAVERAAQALSAARTSAERDAVYDALLAGLKDSHTFRVPAGRIPPRGWGTAGLRIGAQGEGYVITGVIPGSPADRAGLRLADRVLAVDGKPYGRERVNFRDLFLVFEGPVEQPSTAGGGGAPKGLPQRGNVRGPNVQTIPKEGNVEEALSASAVTIDERFSTEVQTHSAIETHGAVADFCLVAEGTGFGIVWIEPGKAHFKVTVYSDQPRYYSPYLPRPTGIADAPNAIIRATAVIQAFEEWAYEYQQRNTYKGESGTVVPKASINAVRSGYPFNLTSTPQVCSFYVDTRDRKSVV